MSQPGPGTFKHAPSVIFPPHCTMCAWGGACWAAGPTCAYQSLTVGCGRGGILVVSSVMGFGVQQQDLSNGTFQIRRAVPLSTWIPIT